MLALAMPVIPAVTLPGRAVAPQQARSCLLSSFNSTTPRDFNVSTVYQRQPAFLYIAVKRKQEEATGKSMRCNNCLLACPHAFPT
jgi:hypothetical protein